MERMERYVSYFKEWQPEIFKKARDSGILSSVPKTTKKDNIPKWLDNFMEKYFSLEAVQTVKKNIVQSDHDRIIIYNNDFYTIPKYTHFVIIMYLIIYKGVNIIKNQKELENWYLHSDLFVGLELGEENNKPYGLYLAGYPKNKYDHIEKLIQTKYKNIAIKIAKLYKTEIIFESLN